jgi:hypothetical protein
MVVIISCPAPFERLEAVAPTIGDRTTRKPYEQFNFVIARSEATKQSSLCLLFWIASLRSQ